jgi:hypothetical protein
MAVEMGGRTPKSPFLRRSLQFLGLLFLVMGTYGIYHATIGYLEGRESPKWPRVTGEVYDHQAYASTHRGVTTYTVFVKYRYSVGGKSYAGERVGPDNDNLTAEESDRVFAKYLIGSKPEVTYSPSNPERSFLEPGESRNALTRPLVHCAFVVAGLALILLNRQPKTAKPRLRTD